MGPASPLARGLPGEFTSRAPYRDTKLNLLLQLSCAEAPRPIAVIVEVQLLLAEYWAVVCNGGKMEDEYTLDWE